MGVCLGGKVFSPSLVVYVNEVIKQARLFARGFVFDDAALALGEIAEAGPGGNFLTSELTLKLFRKAYYRSEIFSQLALEDWQVRGCPRAEEVLRLYTKQMIDGLKTPEGCVELTERGEAFIERYRVHELKKRSSRGSRLRASS
jgi:trimethylamine:corrinoid methyltransferase-like protein